MENILMELGIEDAYNEYATERKTYEEDYSENHRDD